jgi:hypothetical protein
MIIFDENLVFSFIFFSRQGLQKKMDSTTLQQQLLTGFQRFPSVSLQVLLQLSKKTIHLNFQVAQKQVEHLIQDGLLLETQRSNRMMPVYRLTEEGLQFISCIALETKLSKYEEKALETLKAAELTHATMQQQIMDYLTTNKHLYICTLELSRGLQIPFPHITAVLASLVKTNEIVCKYECLWGLR